MRKGANFCLIDMDAACTIGIDTVGFKSSSCYAPPEAIFVNASRTVAVVKSEESRKALNETFPLLVAHESFDIWSLGVVLYQMVNSDVSISPTSFCASKVFEFVFNMLIKLS